MKTNDNIKSIKLIGIIIVLLLIVIIGLLAMPRMTEVREKAFRVEATKIVDAAKNAMNKFNNKELELKDNGESCHKANTYCFTISALLSVPPSSSINISKSLMFSIKSDFNVFSIKFCTLYAATDTVNTLFISFTNLIYFYFMGNSLFNWR